MWHFRLEYGTHDLCPIQYGINLAHCLTRADSNNHHRAALMFLCAFTGGEQAVDVDVGAAGALVTAASWHTENILGTVGTSPSEVVLYTATQTASSE